MRETLLILTLVASFQACSQTVPTIGSDNELEVATWNIEWFGNTRSGPSNETKQFNNIKDVIERTQIDVWGMQEVSNETTWNNLTSSLSNYSGVLSTWSQTQKTGLLFNNKKFKFLYQKHILALYEYEFASGRLPLEVALEYAHNDVVDTCYFFVLHMKANTGSSSDKALALNRRKTAADGLKAYLDKGFRGKYFFVIGDWNDDLDKSIYNNQNTPFAQFLVDTSRYFFASKILTDAGKRSTVYYSNVIDHICASKNAKKGFEAQNNVDVLRLDNYISSYGSTTSDHYPVYLKLNPKKWEAESNASAQTIENSADIFWDGERLAIPFNYNHLQFFGLDGKEFSEEALPTNQLLVYTFKANKSLYTGKFIIQN